MDDAVPNHHAAARHTGAVGFFSALTMIVGRGDDARLVAEMAGVDDTDHVVDLGCGPGTAVRLTARRGARVTGVDPAEPMLWWARLLTRLRRPAGEVEWVRAAAEELPLPDRSATVVWSLASVHHWPDLDRGLSEVRRVLAPGGSFLALEKRTQPGATGHSSHGWTSARADRFAEMLDEAGFVDVGASDHDLGRRGVVVVRGRAPADLAQR